MQIKIRPILKMATRGSKMQPYRKYWQREVEPSYLLNKTSMEVTNIWMLILGPTLLTYTVTTPEGCLNVRYLWLIIDRGIIILIILRYWSIIKSFRRDHIKHTHHWKLLITASNLNHLIQCTLSFYNKRWVRLLMIGIMTTIGNCLSGSCIRSNQEKTRLNTEIAL